VELVFTLFGTTIEFRIGPTVTEEDTSNVPGLGSTTENFGFTPKDPAFPEFGWEEEE
jgi:hypothetical protein